MTFSCTGKISLREAGEHTSGPNLASRDNVAHIGIVNDSRIAGTLEHPINKSDLEPDDRVFASVRPQLLLVSDGHVATTDAAANETTASRQHRKNCLNLCESRRY